MFLKKMIKYYQSHNKELNFIIAITPMVLLIGLIFLFPHVINANTQNKFAVVDMQCLIENYPKNKEAKQLLDSFYSEINQEYNNIRDLPENEQQEKINDLQIKIYNKQQELFEPVKQQLDNDIDEVMKDKNISLLINKQALLRGGEDITTDVLIKAGMDADTANNICTAKNKKNDSPLP